MENPSYRPQWKRAYGIVIQEIREQLGLTRSGLEKKAKVGKGYVTHLEADGVPEEPKHSTHCRIAEALEIAPDELYRRFQQKQGELRGIHEPLALPTPESVNVYDWGEAPEVSVFYGRTDELNILEQWVLHDRCRLIAILGIGGVGKTSLAVKLGMGGIGKSTLSLKLAQQIQGEFEYIIWRSLLGEPAVDYILEDLIKFLSSQQGTNVPNTQSSKILRLLHYLRQHRCLIILDNAESVLRGREYAGQYRDGFEGYGNLFKQIGEAEHQSCLLLTSREKPHEIALLEGQTRPIRSLQLGGLNEAEGRKIFQDNGDFSGSDEEWKKLIEFYNGNPLALDIVAKHIHWTFGGSISRFLREGKNVFGDLQDLLNWHFNRLSESEKEIMYWFAINREPISIESLKENILLQNSREQVAETLQLLGRRLPIERTTMGFTLQPVLIEYMTKQLIRQIYDEIRSIKPNILNSHALIEAQAKDYIRDSQSRVFFKPIIDQISKEADENFLRNQLKKIILKTQKKKIKSGYIGGNIINLLNYIEVDLSDYDFSQMAIWQACLQGVSLHRVNFTSSDLSKSSFTQTFGSISSVQYSPDGRLLAIGHTKNEISIWQVSNGQQISVCKGHSNWVQAISFSFNGQILASGSEDGIIKLWDIYSGGCLETISGHTNKVLSIAFSPDGQALASGSGDQTIKIWRVHDGNCLKTLQGHSGWIFSIAFNPDGKTIASGSGDQTIKIWRVTDGRCLKTLRGHANGVKSVSFNPDGQLLASGSFDRTIRLWNMKDGGCLKLFQDHTDNVLAVAFSPNRQTLASSSSDRTIRIWDLETSQCIKILGGHLSSVWSISYSFDGETIVSGSGDQTVKIWQIQDGRCLKTLQGYINSLWSVAYESNQQLMAAGCEDGSVRLWDSKIKQFKKPLKGHTHIVWSVAFSPNGQVLASGSGDQTIRLWQVKDGRCIETLEGHTGVIHSIAFSPDGQTLASGSEDQTIRLWTPKTGGCTNILRGNTAGIRSFKSGQ